MHLVSIIRQFFSFLEKIHMVSSNTCPILEESFEWRLEHRRKVLDARTFSAGRLELLHVVFPHMVEQLYVQIVDQLRRPHGGLLGGARHITPGPQPCRICTQTGNCRILQLPTARALKYWTESLQEYILALQAYSTYLLIGQITEYFDLPGQIFLRILPFLMKFGPSQTQRRWRLFESATNVASNLTDRILVTDIPQFLPGDTLL